jgi:hypothetical protein
VGANAPQPPHRRSGNRYSRPVPGGVRTLAARSLTRADAARPGDLTVAETTWLLAVPAALALLAALVLLGGPLGRLLFPTPHVAFWPAAAPTLTVRPEPAEQGRYLLAVLAPALLSGVLIALARRGTPRVTPRAAARLSGASQALLVAFLVLAVVAPHAITYGPIYSGAPFKRVYFTWPTLAVALALAGVLAAALRREALVARVRAWARETRRRRLAAFALAALLTGAWLLTAINTEGTIRNANIGVYGNVTYWIQETFAVLDGRAPLVDFHAQYSQLWPYLSAGVMALLGTSYTVYAVLMAGASLLALLAVFALLRRVTRSSLLALGLYLPFMATGFFIDLGPFANRYAPSNLFSMFPMRYGGAYALAWLTARHVDRARPRTRVVLFAVAGIVLVNNVEFGLPAFGATLAALLWSDPALSWRRAARLLGEALAGLLAAAALVALLTLAVAGALPRFSYLFTFSRLWGLGGVTMLPMKPLGFQLAIYVTFAAALVVATVRRARREPDALLTAMLAWAGVFGLGAGSYFAGRSHPEVLISLFSAWALALCLLLVVAVRAILARPARRPALAELAVLAGFGIAVCSLAQLPTPWSQVQRLQHTTATPWLRSLDARRFVAATTHRGERVAILMPRGHLIAYDLGLVNVSPYANLLSMPAVEQLGETVRDLRAAGGRQLFLSLPQTEPQQLRALQGAGFRVIRRNREFAELRDEATLYTN